MFGILVWIAMMIYNIAKIAFWGTINILIFLYTFGINSYRKEMAKKYKAKEAIP